MNDSTIIIFLFVWFCIAGILNLFKVKDGWEYIARTIINAIILAIIYVPLHFIVKYW